MQERENKYYLVLSVYIAALIIGNITASKLFSFLGLLVPAGVVAFSLTFLLTDAIAEIWGRDRARQTVMLGLFTNVLMLVLLQIAIKLPPAPFWGNQDAFQLVLSGPIRIVGAGLAAYILSQFFDVWAFLAIKKLTGGRYLWLRNNGSTYMSQAIDTLIFITIAFYGLVPGASLPNMIVSQYLVKLAITVCNTPILYLLVYWIKGKDDKSNDSPQDPETVHAQRPTVQESGGRSQ